MTTPSRQQLREWSAELTLGPLDPADPKEKAVRRAGRRGPGRGGRAAGDDRAGAGHHHPAALRPSGSGKTTELYRLKGELEHAGFHAAIFDVGNYVNESAPIDVTEFLIALALGAHDVLGTPKRTAGPGSSVGCDA